MLTKALRNVEIKDEDRGTFEAVFATFNQIDSDDDVTLPGAFTDGAPVVVSNFGHTSWSGALPVGKGRIRTTGTEAIATGRFFLDTTHGLDAFRTVKALGDLQEWSYSLDNIKSHRGEHNGKQVRFLERVHVHEVSPVLKGAGVGTRTLVAKSLRQSLDDLDAQAELERQYMKYLAAECRRGIAKADEALGTNR